MFGKIPVGHLTRLTSVKKISVKISLNYLDFKKKKNYSEFTALFSTKLNGWLPSWVWLSRENRNKIFQSAPIFFPLAVKTVFDEYGNILIYFVKGTLPSNYLHKNCIAEQFDLKVADSCTFDAQTSQYHNNSRQS